MFEYLWTNIEGRPFFGALNCWEKRLSEWTMLCRNGQFPNICSKLMQTTWNDFISASIMWLWFIRVKNIVWKNQPARINSTIFFDCRSISFPNFRFGLWSHLHGGRGKIKDINWDENVNPMSFSIWVDISECEMRYFWFTKEKGGRERFGFKNTAIKLVDTWVDFLWVAKEYSKICTKANELKNCWWSCNFGRYFH